MNSKHRTGYGLHDLSRQIARRVQREWEAVEFAPPPPRQDADVILFPAPADPTPPPTEKRPLAA